MQGLQWIDVSKDAGCQREVRKRKRRLTPEERIQRQKRRKRKQKIRRLIFMLIILVLIALVAGIVKLTGVVLSGLNGAQETQEVVRIIETPIQKDIRKWEKFYQTDLQQPDLVVDLLTPNEYSRPGELLPEVNNIFVHYTANAGTTAEQNRSYFESLAETKERSASAHFVIGYDGTMIQCIPTREIGYAVKQRNYDSISIECCYIDESGQFTRETYDALIELTAWLLHKYELEPEDVLRHYDEGGKLCPKYYVENEDAWNQFLTDLSVYMEEAAKEQS